MPLKPDHLHSGMSIYTTSNHTIKAAAVHVQSITRFKLFTIWSCNVTTNHQEVIHSRLIYNIMVVQNLLRIIITFQLLSLVNWLQCSIVLLVVIPQRQPSIIVVVSVRFGTIPVPFMPLWPHSFELVWQTLPCSQCTHFNMYNHVWVFFELAYHVLVLAWGDMHVCSIALSIDSVPFRSVPFCPCVHIV